VLALFPSSRLLRPVTSIFFYVPDFSALWGHFFSIARKKCGFGRRSAPPEAALRAAEARREASGEAHDRPPESSFSLAFVGRAATMSEIHDER